MNPTETKSSLYKMLENLFLTNNLVLYGRIDDLILEQDSEEVKLIERYFLKESIGYPDESPIFDSAAATWSAKILFYAAQLVMYREHSAETLDILFPSYKTSKTAAAILSADVCLRFLPSILVFLEQIDIEDELIPILKTILKEWHYSGLISEVDIDPTDLEETLKGDCLRKLYVNRVIEYKREKIGQKEEIKRHILSALGNYKSNFWKEYNTET